MKKISVLFLLSMFVFCGAVSARTTYDSKGKIIFDNTIRGQKRAAMQQIETRRQADTAAAAKIDYSAVNKALENETPMQSNYYQDRNKTSESLNKTLENETPMQSNYYQDKVKTQK